MYLYGVKPFNDTIKFKFMKVYKETKFEAAHQLLIRTFENDHVKNFCYYLLRSGGKF